MKSKNKKRPSPISENLRDESHTLRHQGKGAIPSDVLGSYTGTPDTDDIPEQDADDL